MNLLHSLSLSHHLLHGLVGRPLQFLLKVERKVHGHHLVGHRDTGSLKLGNERTLSGLVPEIQCAEVDFGKQELRHPADVLLSGLRIFLHHLAVEGTTNATLQLKVIVLLSFCNDLAPLHDVTADLVLEAEHQLLTDLTVEGRGCIGSGGATSNQGFTNSPRLQ